MKGRMKKPHAGAKTAHQLDMLARLSTIRSSREPPRAVCARCHTVPLAKRSAEYLMALKPAGQRDVENGILSREQHSRRAIQSQAQRELFGRFAGRRQENAMQMKRR